MKKLLVIIASTVIASSAIAAPHKTVIEFICPPISSLLNLGSFTSGIGHEKVGTSTASRPEFKGPMLAGVGSNFSSYSSSGTKYSASTGRVTCNYSSSTLPAFDVSYLMQNGANGQVTKSSVDEINISLLVGFTG
jgi:hypothetical protein